MSSRGRRGRSFECRGILRTTGCEWLRNALRMRLRCCVPQVTEQVFLCRPIQIESPDLRSSRPMHLSHILQETGE